MANIIQKFKKSYNLYYVKLDLFFESGFTYFYCFKQRFKLLIYFKESLVTKIMLPNIQNDSNRHKKVFPFGRL